MMDHEQRERCLTRMQAASSAFYTAACMAGNHAFIEFCGLMNEYIGICRGAHDAGVDFTEMNVHAGKHLPMAGYQLEYLNEKMACIYGLQLERRNP